VLKKHLDELACLTESAHGAVERPNLWREHGCLESLSLVSV
jgi:hypothetical protein